MTIFQIISKEAWWRIFYSLVAICSCTFFNLWKISSWVLLICLPITQLESKAQFIFTDISAAFGSACFLAFIVSLQFCAPILFYQGMSFFNPGLFKHESRKIFIVGVLFIGCNLIFNFNFLNFWVTYLLTFFLQFQFNAFGVPLLSFQAKIISYLQFLFNWCCGFQFLLLLGFSSFLISPIFLKNIWLNKKHVFYFLTCLFISFVLPPDGMLQFFLTTQILVFFDLLGFLLFLRILYQEKLQTRTFS